MEKISYSIYNNGENIFDILIGSNEEILAKREEILTHDYMGEIAYHIGEPSFRDGIQYCLILEDNETFGVSLYIKPLIEVAQNWYESQILGYISEKEECPLRSFMSRREWAHAHGSCYRLISSIEEYNSLVYTRLYGENIAVRDMSEANLPDSKDRALEALSDINGIPWYINTDGYITVGIYGKWETPFPWAAR